MAISKKIVIKNDKIDLITTKYNKTFIDNINRNGRPKINYDSLSNNQFKAIRQNKINYLKNKTIKKLDTITSMNKFKYWITIHVNSKKDYYKFIDRLKKSDKDLIFLSLAAWSINSNLHYHILLNCNLDKNDIIKRFHNLDYDIKTINNQNKLIGYIRKNIVRDIIGLLTSDDLELKLKQIEILQYKNILSNSKNINKPIIKKLDKDIKIKDIKELKNTEYIETYEYKNLDSSIQIDKFQKLNDDDIELNNKLNQIFK